MDLWDVVAVSIATNTVRVLSTSKGEPNAEAIVRMAVHRRGVGDEVFLAVPQGSYQDGDRWAGQPTGGREP